MGDGELGVERGEIVGDVGGKGVGIEDAWGRQRVLGCAGVGLLEGGADAVGRVGGGLGVRGRGRGAGGDEGGGLCGLEGVLCEEGLVLLDGGAGREVVLDGLGLALRLRGHGDDARDSNNHQRYQFCIYTTRDPHPASFIRLSKAHPQITSTYFVASI